ncbi:adenylyl-sulfate kinase [Vibrio natriegens]|uniref:Adenylyl-sulfate kinase n=1 Tax=Vibrio natriegens NBRC 15636 = ATCC 14048 = DSM 759 TaxID=1219067 RepID=A0AAN0Y011_VIBNA|nr:adenylyl-sulfate kinase [Vibrio natriegens]ALR16617.1 adenylylsulfate kinase [Vibrio natriegens NBRC 15636 = ATCC 14048 = DSM 759]ANQ11517.1 adenylyl-sulfate kinase [Vibrio natriegens NBRC 15636 = ATCC 14048 = DSM 759]EPM39070.1 adenylylsulfate kinase [Vibrio natriegens NBRC 15636 = ATCC 14048 = DSM 759]MDX6025850.1 adenylyl-sulfate kinase [Vibrio natriegens NBRC 15636 = ATCC 14048 = DSM 759]UUI11966.1 adenylyl-sulfate kinase [Vibrio natriegens]
MTADTTVKDENIVWHQHSVDKKFRADLKQQKPAVLWFTGLSGAGKSTVAGALENRLAELGYHTYLLDGDNVRHGLCSDLGFSEQDRRENIRRIGELAKLMADAGLIVLSAFISPHRAERQLVRDLLPEGEFIEVFVNASLEVCEGRDPKGLYRKARAGEIPNFTGIDSEYQAPKNPEIDLPAGEKSVDELVELCINDLKQRGVIR